MGEDIDGGGDAGVFDKAFNDVGGGSTGADAVGAQLQYLQGVFEAGGQEAGLQAVVPKMSCISLDACTPLVPNIV